MTLHTRKKSDARCQCTPDCNRPVLNNSPFCETHIKYCRRRSPMTGREPDFNPDRFNKLKGIKEAHNCFAYAFDYINMPKSNNCNDSSCPVPFPQPGRTSGYPKWSKVKGKRCPDLLARLFGDVKGLKLSSFEEKCKPNMSKIALVADEDEDYHFYRQDSNGFWSHKPGATSVTHLDATKRPIYDPQLASRKYDDTSLNYDKFCGYLCVPKDRKLYFKRGGNINKTKKKSRKTTRKATRKAN
jgi:hypothetical protein